jgi:hypothetical protein
MRELQAEVIGDRRVRLDVDSKERYTILIEVWTAQGWEDISLRTDRALALHSANRRFRLRVIEQQARALGLHV